MEKVFDNSQVKILVDTFKIVSKKFVAARYQGWKIMFVSVYLSSQPVAHLSNAPRRLLIVTGNSARLQDKTTESSSGSLKSSVYTTALCL